MRKFEHISNVRPILKYAPVTKGQATLKESTVLSISGKTLKCL